MELSDPREILERVRALPAGAPVVQALSEVPGVFLVGGAVRDLLLGGRPVDLDLVVVGDSGVVASRLGGRVVVHDRFGTSTVRLGGFTYDVARARKETYARPGALPDVTPAGIDEDLNRRDFTVNAIAIALGGPEAGQLKAAPHALDDLDARRLRVLHDASFTDDPTRLMRLARYQGRLGFAVEPGTLDLLRRSLAAGALDTVSGPRLGNELRLLSAQADPLAGLGALRELELDRALHPGFGLEDDQLARRALALLPAEAGADRLVLAAAARRIPEDELRRWLDRLGFPGGDREVIVAAASGAEAMAGQLAAAHRPSEVAAAAYGAPPELVALGGGLGPEAGARDWLNELQHVRLEIDGADLLAAGVPEGPALGRGLRAALAAKLDGRAQGREEELAAALEVAGTGG